MAVKYKTYVAVFFPDHWFVLGDSPKTYVKFVTGTEGTTAHWEADKPAVALSESFAKDIVYGLTMNGYAAAVIKVLDTMKLWN